MSLPIYESGQAEALASAQGWKYRRSGDQLNVETCPFCGKGGYKFYISDTKGLWDCKSGGCAQKGNFYLLEKHLGVETERAVPLKVQQRQEAKKKEDERPKVYIKDLAKSKERLQNDPTAWQYLLDRGFTPETIAAWHLGLFTDQRKNQRIGIPYIEGDEVVDIKYRLLGELKEGDLKYIRRGGGRSILFGAHLMLAARGQEDRPLFITEGEFDAITLWQNGFGPVISTTTGAQSFKPEWYDAVIAYNPTCIYLIYDNDAAGQKNANEILAKFGDRKAFSILLPEDVKDSNEYFLKYSADDFTALLQEAEILDEPENCISIGTMANMLAEQIWTAGNAFDGHKSAFEDLNVIMGGGYWNAQMTLLSGSSGTGKTSFVLQEFLTLSKQGVPSYLICLEMTPEMMTRKMIQHQYGVDVKDCEMAHVERFTKELGKLPFRYGFKAKTIEAVVDDMRMAVRRYGSKIIAFDNINFFVRSADANQQQAELARVSKAMQEASKELRVPIIMIAQPKKFDDHDRAIRLNDVKDTNALIQDSDTVILMYRKPAKDREMTNNSHDNKDPYTMLLVEKARYASGGHCTLFFDGARSHFSKVNAA